MQKSRADEKTAGVDQQYWEQRNGMADAAHSKSQNRRLKDIFHAADSNGDGRISDDEMKRVLAEVGEWKEEEFTELFKQADANNDGYLNVDEFIDWLVPQSRMTKNMLTDFADSIKEIFENFDTDGTGSISRQELKEGLKQKIVDGLMPEDALKYFDEADKGGDGVITLGEFNAWMDEVVPSDEWDDPDLK